MWVATLGPIEGVPSRSSTTENTEDKYFNTLNTNNMSNILLMVQKSGSPVHTTNIPLLARIWYIPGGDRRISEASTVLRPIVNGNM